MSNSFQSWLREHRFALRRLHSLSGIVPIGLFLINHLLANSTAFLDEPHFNHHVGLIHSLPWLLAVEIVFIFIPLAFHAALGVTIAWEGKANQFQYPYMNNWRYTLQRVTAWITVVFVMVHLLHFRFAHWLGGAEYKAANPAFYWVTQEGFLDVLLPAWLWMVVYMIGLTAAVYHFCNGIVTFCITWGLTISDNSRKRVSLVAGGLAVVLMAWGVLSLYALGTAQAQMPPPTDTATSVVQNTVG